LNGEFRWLLAAQPAWDFAATPKPTVVLEAGTGSAVTADRCSHARSNDAPAQYPDR